MNLFEHRLKRIAENYWEQIEKHNLRQKQLFLMVLDLYKYVFQNNKRNHQGAKTKIVEANYNFLIYTADT